MTAALAAALLALAGCGDTATKADYERLERRIQALEERERARIAAEDAANAPVNPDDERARLLRGELALLGRPAPPIQASQWLQGNGDAARGQAPYLLAFFPVGADAAAPLTDLAARADARDLAVLGVARGATAEGATAWLRDAGLGFPVALDADEATTRAYERSAAVSAALVKGGVVVWTGTPAGLDRAVLDKHL